MQPGDIGWLLFFSILHVEWYLANYVINNLLEFHWSNFINIPWVAKDQVMTWGRRLISVLFSKEVHRHLIFFAHFAVALVLHARLHARRKITRRKKKNCGQTSISWSSLLFGASLIASSPASWGIWGYKPTTSVVTIIVPARSFSTSLSLFRKTLVS